MVKSRLGIGTFWQPCCVCCDFHDCWPHEGKASSGGWQRRSVSFLLSPDVNLQEGGQWGLEWPCRGKHWRWIGYFGLSRKCLLSHQAHKYRQRTKRWAKSLMWSKDDRWARGGESTKTKASSKVPLYWVSRLVREGGKTWSPPLSRLLFISRPKSDECNMPSSWMHALIRLLKIQDGKEKTFFSEKRCQK